MDAPLQARPLYAQDPASADSLAAALGPHMRRDPDLHWAALVDPVFDLDSPRQPGLADGGPSISCYDHPLLEDLAGLRALAPCLHPLSVDPRGRAAFEALARHASGRPMLGVVASRIPLEDLVGRWAPLHKARGHDGDSWLLRVADTRVLPQLPTVLTPAQWKAWTGPLAHWFFVDRTGQLASCAIAAAPQTPEASSMVLDDAQFAALTQAMEADHVYARLAQTMPAELFDTLRPSLAFDNMQKACAFCAEHRVVNFFDICEVALRACASRGRCLTDLHLLEVLVARSWSPGRLAEAFADRRLAA